jgi:uncharacterized OB-fold protein
VSGRDRIGAAPKITAETAPFWAAAETGVLLIEQCTVCGTFAFPPHGVCAHCGARSMRWERLAAPGVIYSYTINHNQWTVDADVDYGIALVEFPAQSSVRMIGLLADFVDEPAIGQQVGFRLDPALGGLHRATFVPWAETA